MAQTRAIDRHTGLPAIDSHSSMGTVDGGKPVALRSGPANISPLPDFSPNLVVDAIGGKFPPKGETRVRPTGGWSRRPLRPGELSKLYVLGPHREYFQVPNANLLNPPVTPRQLRAIAKLLHPGKRGGPVRPSCSRRSLSTVDARAGMPSATRMTLRCVRVTC